MGIPTERLLLMVESKDTRTRSNHVPSSSFFDQFRVPGGAIAEHGVEDGEEFSGDRDEGDFVRFAGRFEAREEGFERRIEAAGTKLRHVQRIAHVYGVDPLSLI